ncbi:MAG: flagellar basal body-associated FliL family protein [Hyphomonas sp.]
MAGKKKTPDTPPADGETEGKKGGGGLIGVVMLSVAAIAASFGASYMLTPAAAAPTEMAECTPHDVAKVHEPVRKDHTFVPLEEILITIGSEPATRFLKMEVSVMTDAEHAYQVEQDAPILIDAFINYLRSVELEDFEDPAYYGKMREQLSRRSELVLGSSASDGILVTSFLLR